MIVVGIVLAVTLHVNVTEEPTVTMSADAFIATLGSAASSQYG